MAKKIRKNNGQFEIVEEHSRIVSVEWLQSEIMIIDKQIADLSAKKQELQEDIREMNKLNE